MDFMRTKYVWFGVSIVLIAVGLISLAFQGLNWGIDFTGGTIFHMKIDPSIKVADVRAVLDKHNLGADSVIQRAGEKGDEMFVRIKPISDADRRALIADFNKELKIDINAIQSDKVDAVIGKELRNNALLGILIASIGMLIYITLRFEFKFAIAAIIALLHDVFIMLGTYSVFQLQVNSSFVAAVLTIVGYSINDTIVVFDRIRENLRLRKKESIDTLVNNSINSTLARSINTLLTTLFTITAVYIFGGETIKDFAFSLIVGLVSGGYSSIFIASPLWALWKERELTAKKKPVRA